MRAASLALLGGLAGSSCCLLQLLLNALGLGCAGFAALTPWRPVFIALTCAALAAAHTRHHSWRQTGTAIGIALIVTSAPEWTEAVGRAGGVAGLLPTVAKTTTTTPPVLLSFRLTGVKCAACGERARSAAASVPGVASATVTWREGCVRVALEPRADAGATVDKMTTALKQADFGVISVQPAQYHDEV